MKPIRVYAPNPLLWVHVTFSTGMRNNRNNGMRSVYFFFFFLSAMQSFCVCVAASALRSIVYSMHAFRSMGMCLCFFLTRTCVGMKRRACVPSMPIVLVFWSMCYVRIRIRIDLFTSWCFEASYRSMENFNEHCMRSLELKRTRFYGRSYHPSWIDLVRR